MTYSAANLTRRTLIATLALIVLFNGALSAVIAQDAPADESHTEPAAAATAQPPAAEARGQAQSKMMVFELEHLSPDEALTLIPQIVGQGARFSAVPQRSAIIVYASPDVLDSVESLIEGLDVSPTSDWSDPVYNSSRSSDSGQLTFGGAAKRGFADMNDSWAQGEIKLFTLQHISPAFAVMALNPLFGYDAYNTTEDGKMVFDPKAPFVPVPSRRIVVARVSPELVHRVAEIIKALDVPGEHKADEFLPPATSTPDETPVAGAHQSTLDPAQFDSMHGFRFEGIRVGQNRLDELRGKYTEHNARARQQAAPLRELASSGALAQSDERRQALAIAVADAFAARQNLQRAELDALAAKIASMRQMLEARERIKDQIIQRRVEELLNPALEWDTSKAEPPTAESPAVSTITTSTPPATPERLYQSRTESDWRRLFEAETEPAARLDAAVALLHLASSLPPDEYVNRIIEIGGELVDAEYGNEPLEFAFESIPPLRWANFANLGADKERRDAYLRFHNDFMRRVGAVPPTILANRLGVALTKGTDADAAFAFYVFAHTCRQVISASPGATSEFSAQLDIPVTGLDHSSLAALARLFVGSPEEGEQRTDRVAQCLELVRVLRECPASADRVRQGFESWLMTPYHNFLQFNKSLLSEPQFTSALAGLALDDVLKSRENSLAIVQSPLVVNNVLMPYEQMMVGSTRVYSGPALHGWANVANEYLSTHKRLRYTDGDRTIMNGVFRTTSLYSDGDDWPVQRTAEILTDQLHAAYADENAPLVETPMSELVPASPAIMLSQIVAITGEIPEFITKGHPKSANTATKLRNLDRLLAGENAESVEGILGEAPVEALRSIVTDIQVLERKTFVGQPGHPGNLLHRLLDTKSTLNPQATTPVQGGFGGGGTTTSRQPVDPLLLLAVLPDLTGESEERDLVIAALGPLDIAGATFADHIRNLLASQLQSRRHAQRMLREMAAKTESQPLLNMIKSIDPTAVEPAADAEEPPKTLPQN